MEGIFGFWFDEITQRLPGERRHEDVLFENNLSDDDEEKEGMGLERKTSIYDPLVLLVGRRLCCYQIHADDDDDVFLSTSVWGGMMLMDLCELLWQRRRRLRTMA